LIAIAIVSTTMMTMLTSPFLVSLFAKTPVVVGIVVVAIAMYVTTSFSITISIIISMMVSIAVSLTIIKAMTPVMVSVPISSVGHVDSCCCCWCGVSVDGITMQQQQRKKENGYRASCLLLSLPLISSQQTPQLSTHKERERERLI
jgi:hypothetical protein